jgi:hypothetical protein
MPEPRPYTPRPDDSAADMASLVALGGAEPQPIPEPPPPAIDPFLEPAYPDGYAPDDAA